MARRAAVRPAMSSHRGSEPSIACSATEAISTRISSGTEIRSLRPSQIVSEGNRNTLVRKREQLTFESPLEVAP
jgi:hypothetical protein